MRGSFCSLGCAIACAIEHRLRDQAFSKYADYTQVPDYHFILDNPWESTEDIMKGLRLVCTLPPPYNLLPSSLIFYPGTEFFYKAMITPSFSLKPGLHYIKNPSGDPSIDDALIGTVRFEVTF